ncbi:hypothetical protein Pd630_LPD05641 [Rhodococcus opacus PD630]|nr:hypothetical protein Pd630_LPD05641 [Rhodococcus opacus PD630]
MMHAGTDFPHRSRHLEARHDRWCPAELTTTHEDVRQPDSGVRDVDTHLAGPRLRDRKVGGLEDVYFAET